MLSPHRFRRLGSALILFLVAGCTGSTRCAVDGHVSYDGDPVDQGGIAFIPADNASLVRATGQIVDGKYKLDAQRGPEPGTYRVEITWRKKTGRKTPGEGGQLRDEVEQAIPAKFNSASELVREVKPGHNTFDFILKE